MSPSARSSAWSARPHAAPHITQASSIMSEARLAFAARACLTCHKQKRKCTKEIPECSLCRKNGRPCRYGASTNPSTESDTYQADVPLSQCASRTPPVFALQGSIGPGPGRTNIPTSFFLDSDYFQEAGHSVDRAVLTLPPELVGGLVGQPQIRYIVDIYCNSIHTFFPIVSKLRLYQELSISGDNLNADTTLLLIAMQLHTQPVDNIEPPYQDVYRTAKACFSYVEASNLFSVRLLQAALLIALYEISNAIYPASYLTVGHCARLGHAMGFHDRKRTLQMVPSPTTTTELEERRRVWWAVIILDRYVNLGIKNRPFACEDARVDEYLPIDDKFWDRGELTLVQPLAVSTSTTVLVSPFARSCQAAHLLSRVLRHRDNSNSDIDVDFTYQEAIQLHRTAKALYSTISNQSEALVERMSDTTAHSVFCTAMALCFSALLTLYDMYCCIEHMDADQMGNPSLVEMLEIAISGLKEVSAEVVNFSRRVQAIIELGGMLRTTPLICDCLYQAATTYLWYFEETWNEENLLVVSNIKNVLDTLGTRWKLPGKYTRLLEEYQERKERSRNG